MKNWPKLSLTMDNYSHITPEEANSAALPVFNPAHTDADLFVFAPFTGSIQASELEEAITEAYAKHGHNLSSLIRKL